MKKLYFILGILVIFVFFQCNSNAKKNQVMEESKNEERIEQGRMIAQSTFSALSAELKQAMEDGGVKSAIEYCNITALPLTDSLAQIHNVNIRRVSERYRNPKNKPIPFESQALQKFNNALTEKQTLKPFVEEIEGRQTFFAPIMVQDLCLKCHGEEENIPDYPIIKKYYPEDLATGYTAGDLRGIWSITFNKI